MQADNQFTESTDNAAEAVRAAGVAARQAMPSIAAADRQQIDAALTGMAKALSGDTAEILTANRADVEAAQAGGMADALIDRLRLSPTRLADMAEQLHILVAAEVPPATRVVRTLATDGDEGDELVLLERRRPIGVIGANFEARPNVTVDIASQLLKSQNAGVLRTGSAALRSASALIDHVIAPSLAAAELDPALIQLIRYPSRDTALALVAQPGLIPLVILRGSGDSTRLLTQRAAEHGVRTLAHADGGGVLYVDKSADLDLAVQLITRSLDRLGVCNRLNLLLIDQSIYQQFLPQALNVLEGLHIEPSLPPHTHPRGLEWALESGREATVTIDAATGPAAAAQIASAETSGLAAGIVAEDKAAARLFFDTYTGTGVFWNSTTRLLDGFKLLRVPETGINVDHVPGPRGPVTFHDLYMRQFAVVPAGSQHAIAPPSEL